MFIVCFSTTVHLTRRQRRNYKENGIETGGPLDLRKMQREVSTPVPCPPFTLTEDTSRSPMAALVLKHVPPGESRKEGGLPCHHARVTKMWHRMRS